jgi:beta-galactosidase GanA
MRTGFDRIGIIHFRDVIRVDTLHNSCEYGQYGRSTAYLSPRFPDDFNHVALNRRTHARWEMELLKRGNEAVKN